MFGLKSWVVISLSTAGILFVGYRSWSALSALVSGNEGQFLAFPLTVILPALAFAFLVKLRRVNSAEGALMQFGAMIQLLLIVAWPSFALYLALGFPVVFLVVEIFETRLPALLRDPIKRAVLL